MDSRPPDSPPVPPALARSRAISHLLDDILPIPGTSWRIGLDPLLGLVPGLGDWVGWAASLNLLYSAGQVGASPWLLIRMLGNVALDAAVGALPFLGDLFDAGWKANVRNLRLLEAHVENPDRTRAASRWLVGGVLAAATGMVAASAWTAIWILRQVLGLLGGLFS